MQGKFICLCALIYLSYHYISPFVISGGTFLSIHSLFASYLCSPCLLSTFVFIANPFNKSVLSSRLSGYDIPKSSEQPSLKTVA